MKMEQELWDLYTKDRQLTGETHVRGEALPKDRFHLVVHVWIRNSNGDYLIAQRSETRPTFPLQWECVGGSVLQGETGLEGALREVKEEVGLTLAPDDGTLLFSEVRDVVNGKPFRDIMDVWLFRYDGEITLDLATTDEVAQAKWMTREQIRALFEQGKLVGTLEYFFTKL